MSYDKVMKDTKERMDKALKHTHDQLRNIRTSRASSGLVENIRVDYYGSPTPLSQIAQISVPEPRQLVIKPFDASAIEEIGKAMAQIYATNFTEQELKDLIAFYKSPLGQKFLEQEPKSITGSLAYMNDWAGAFSNEVAAKFRAEMRARGKEI